MSILPYSAPSAIPQDVGSRQFACLPLGLICNPRISAQGKVLYGLLAAKYLNYQTRVTVPVSRQALAADLQVDLATIRRALAELRQAEVITIAHRHDRTGNKLPSAYHLVEMGQKTSPTPRGKNAPTLGAKMPHQRSDLRSEKKEERRAPRARQPAWRPKLEGRCCPHDIRCRTCDECLQKSLAEARA